VAEHTLRVIWIALMLAKKEKVKNEEKVIKMALLHDTTESRTGDVDYLSRQYVEMEEELAIKDILKDTLFEKDFIAIWKEYEKKQSIEAKIVKDADTLDCDLELREQEIQTVSNKFIKSRSKIVKPKLYTKSADEFWRNIYKSDIHSWHFLGRNRFNNGDWKKK
jgi:putative hydrolase of HD superfamily